MGLVAYDIILAKGCSWTNFRAKFQAREQAAFVGSRFSYQSPCWGPGETLADVKESKGRWCVVGLCVGDK